MSKIGRSKKSPKVSLACEVCLQRNYHVLKSHKMDTERLELKKHCPHCQQHTLHKETK